MLHTIWNGLAWVGLGCVLATIGAGILVALQIEWRTRKRGEFYADFHHVPSRKDVA